MVEKIKVEVGQIMERAKRPYEGSDAYEAGKKDAIKDLYDKLVKLDECFIITKDDIIECLRREVDSK